MIAYGSFALLRPWWLLAAPIVIILFRRMRFKGAGLADWERAVDPPLLAAMLRRGVAVGGRRPHFSAVLWAIVLMALALSGPALKRRDADRFRNLDATLILVDLSNAAVEAGYLRRAATAAEFVLDAASSKQTGLILYAGDAYLGGSLTDDAAATSTLIFALDDRTVPDPGVRPDRALELARRVLHDAGIIHGDVTLISAGGGVDEEAVRAARALAADGHNLFTLFAPTEGSADKPEAERRAGLARLAEAGHGLSENAARPERVLDAIRGRAVERLGASSVTSLYWRDYGRYVLLLAAIPLLIAFRGTVAFRKSAA
jgi:Ca-activated chloride channel family protein